MTRKLLSATLILLCCANASAQDGDFAGRWVKDLTRSESAAQEAAAAAESPTTLIIEQSPTRLRIERQRTNGSNLFTYSFGLPEKDIVPIAVGTNGSDIPGRAEWKDGGLLLRNVWTVNGMSMTTAATLTLMPNGREMIVVTNVQMHHGYESTNVGRNASSTGKDVYIKAER